MNRELTISEILAEHAAWNMLSDEEQIRRREIELGIAKTEGRTKKRKQYWKYYTKEEWAVTREAVFNRDGKVCYICKGIATQVDHVLPKSKFPELALDLENLKPVCWPCNRKKNTKVS